MEESPGNLGLGGGGEGRGGAFLALHTPATQVAQIPSLVMQLTALAQPLSPKGTQALGFLLASTCAVERATFKAGPA